MESAPRQGVLRDTLSRRASDQSKPALICDKFYPRGQRKNGLTGGVVSCTTPSTSTLTVTQCGRICFGRRKIGLSTALAGQNVGVKEVSDRIWLVSFMDYDLGFFDHETGRLEPVDNPFEPKVSPV